MKRGLAALRIGPPVVNGAWWYQATGLSIPSASSFSNLLVCWRW